MGSGGLPHELLADLAELDLHQGIAAHGGEGEHRPLAEGAVLHAVPRLELHGGEALRAGEDFAVRPAPVPL